MKIKAQQLPQKKKIQHFVIMFLQIKYHLHSSIQSKITYNMVVHQTLGIITKTKIFIALWIITHLIHKMFTLLSINLCLLITMLVLLIPCKWLLHTIAADLVTFHDNINIQVMEIIMGSFRIAITHIISLDVANRDLKLKIIQIIVSVHRIRISIIIHHLFEHLCIQKIANKHQKMIRVKFHRNQSKTLSYNKMARSLMVW